MSAPLVEDAPVDTGGDEGPDHIACPHLERAWCGLDTSGLPWVVTPSTIDRVCRVCLLAYEMFRAGDPCPVCGCSSCTD